MYKFELNIKSITSPVKGGGFIVVNPILSGNGMVKYTDNSYFGVVRKKIKKEVLFTGQEYRALKTLSDAGVQTLEMNVYYGVSLRWSGYLLLSGSWNEDTNECELETQTIDQYSELVKNIDAEVNITNFASNTIRAVYYSVVVELTLPCFKGSRSEAEFYYDPNGEISDNPLVAHSDWQYYNDDGSIYCGVAGTFQYKYKTTYLFFPYAGYGSSILYPSQYFKKSSTSETVWKYFSRAAKLFDVLEELIDESDPEIIISESGYSSYINNSANLINHLYIMDKSDVKRNAYYDPEITPAVFELITLKELLEMYLGFFDLSYRIDTSKNFTLIRRSSLTEKNYTLNPQYNLTNYKNINFTENQKRYNSNLNERPCKEVIKMEQCNRAFFDSSELVYDSFTDNIESKNYAKFNNNLDYLQGDPDEASDDGFCVISCTSVGTIRNQNSLVGGSLINGGMSAQLLFYNHLLDNKPYSEAELDGFEVDLTKAKLKEIIYKNIPYYDIDAIDFDYYVKTELGLAEPKELEISFEKEFAVLKLNI